MAIWFASGGCSSDLQLRNAHSMGGLVAIVLASHDESFLVEKKCDDPCRSSRSGEVHTL